MQGGAPDVVYAYTPTADVAVDVSTCGSLFDTRLYIFDDPHNLQVQIIVWQAACQTCGSLAAWLPGWPALLKALLGRLASLVSAHQPTIFVKHQNCQQCTQICNGSAFPDPSCAHIPVRSL